MSLFEPTCWILNVKQSNIDHFVCACACVCVCMSIAISFYHDIKSRIDSGLDLYWDLLVNGLSLGFISEMPFFV